MGERKSLRSGASSDALLLTFIKLVTMALGIVTTRLLSQKLSVYDYGTYSQILLVVGTVSSVTILGMMDGVNYFQCSVSDPERREQYVTTIFALQGVVGTVAGCVVIALSAPLCAYFDNPDVEPLLIFGAVLPVMQNLLGMMQVLLVSVGKARMIAVRNLIVSLCRLGAVLAVVWIAEDVRVLLATTLVLDLGQIGLFLLVLRSSGCALRPAAVRPALTGEILRYSAPMAVFTMVNALNRDLDKYIIALWTDTETLALYSNASKILPFDIIMISFCTVLLPRITRLVAEKRRVQAAELYRRFLELSLITNVLLCCAALAAAPELMELLYSEKYLAGLEVFRIYIVADLVRFMTITLILSAAGKTKTLMVAGIGSLAVNCVLNVVFLPLLGMEGPALATLAVTVLMGVAMLMLGARELECDVRKFFDGKFLAVFLGEAAALLAVFCGLRGWLEKIGLGGFWRLVLVAGGYCAALLVLSGKRLLGDLKQINRQEEA